MSEKKVEKWNRKNVMLSEIEACALFAEALAKASAMGIGRLKIAVKQKSSFDSAQEGF